MRQFKKGITALFAAFFMVGIVVGTAPSVSAHDVPDMERKGTVSITMKCGETKVSGGTLTAYRVGDIVEDDGNYDFALNDDFKESGVELYNKETSEFEPTLDKAKELAAYAKEKSLTGQTKTVGEDGTVKFEELEPALYLFVQDTAAKGYYAADPFMVSLPMHEDDVYIYDVDATPKVELKKAPPEKPTGTLPQTGQLNWPIPILAISGLLLFALGWIIKKGKV